MAKPALNKKEKLEYGYMYIGHLPHGFYEDEIKSYFSQFGKVCRVRLAHSKLTGNPKGYGFIQFENKEVAQIASETMNNYLMFNKLLKCHLIPREKLHPETFKNAKKKFFKPLACMFRKKFNKKRTQEQLKKMKERQNEKLKKRQEKLKELGINLDLNELLNPKKKDTNTDKKEKPQKITKGVKNETKQKVELPQEQEKKQQQQIIKENNKRKQETVEDTTKKVKKDQNKKPQQKEVIQATKSTEKNKK